MRVAFVVQRCGPDVVGGAESLCLQVAHRMSKYWQTEVLTTCARDYVNWQNSYPPGEEQCEATLLRRFKVDRPRHTERFNRLSAELHGRSTSATPEEQERWMREQGPISTPLFDYLRYHREQYDAFVFFGYLYATTYFGLPLVRDRAYLAPLAHDEWPIYFTMWDRVFSQARDLIFQTEEERDFIQRRFPDCLTTGLIAGIGIDPPDGIVPARFRDKYDLESKFLLYVGRVDESKGCGEMFDFFVRSKAFGGRYDLVVLGSEAMPVPYYPRLVYIGRVSEQEKWDAMAACDWLLLPSRFESLSITLLETWATGRPAIVNGTSDVLRAHCTRSGGGLWYDSWDQCQAILETVSKREKSTLGVNGRSYVLDHYSWSRVEQAYLCLVGERSVSSSPRQTRSAMPLGK